MQLEASLERDDRIVLPLGSTEQHASLSLGTDSILAERVSVEAAEPLGVPVLPVLAYGLTPYFAAYPGSPTLRVETFLAVLRDLLDSLLGQRFKRVLLVNGHGGNAPGGALAAERMAVAIRASFRPGVDPEAVSLATPAGALAVCLVLAAPFLGGLTWHGVWPFLVAGLVAPGLSQVLFVRAIEAVGASRTAILVGVSPFLSALFAISLLGEPVRAGLVFGTVAIVGGAVALVSTRSATARLTAAGATAGVLAPSLISPRDHFLPLADPRDDVPGVVAPPRRLLS